jgi:hypothetical protein
MIREDRHRLAAALTAATGVLWTRTGEPGDIMADGATRRVGERITVTRVGVEGRINWYRVEGFHLNTGKFAVWQHRQATFAGATGRDWLPRFVAAALPAIAAFDAVGYARPMNPRDARRAETFRRLLRPESGACESERAQAAEHLARLGAAPA